MQSAAPPVVPIRTAPDPDRIEGPHRVPPVADFTLGVEEESQIRYPETRELRQRAGLHT
jgi:hypothetical protein